MRFLSRTLTIAVSILFVGCTVHPVVHDWDRKEAVRVQRITVETPNELHFRFRDNVALFWHVDLKASYLRHDSFEKLAIASRPGYNKDGSKRGLDLYVSRADHAPLALGRYSFHLVLNAAYPDYPKYKVTEIQTGAFTLSASDVQPQ